ncbi:hypothetical protein TraAM80_01432 [Trypanosoma rangeli]|uniref:Uncharacterized protein n=1 Tax=Trypanosoma rangeli TaxID=5698 RepID=A0A422NYS6_TRYRA|nr:uncharacterized protein TraAM80_01432 [Trypanosoma rangeli]RNF10616.1 hypothetical protein TraAM80_01432 [Trypanosoma rangeli]|eukprot:RNF10616.1 hypothetical protein TraAM80_01432 [Trypanosoma rangeli]
MEVIARSSAAGGGGSQDAACSTSLSSLSPVVVSPLSRGLLCKMQEWPGVDAVSPPLREKTEKPNMVEYRLVEPNFATSAEISQTSDLNVTNRCEAPSTPTATPSTRTGGTANPLSCRLREGNSNTCKMNPACRVTLDRAAERSRARGLQRCLLETEAKAQKFSAAAKLREQESLAAVEEVARLREAALLQARRIGELEQRLAQAQLAVAGADKGRVGDQPGELTDSVDSLESPCIDDIKRILHCTAEAIRRIEVEFEAERRRRCALENENNALRRKLHFARRADDALHDGGLTHCSVEGYSCAMAFVQGPLQRFLTESAELQRRLATSSTSHTSAHS